MHHRTVLNYGVGATETLNLRVSVATLARVMFRNPKDDEWMLALERKATLHQTENGNFLKIISHPFGGAVRILDLTAVQASIGDFHFDSKRSLSEQDFRLFVQPSSWPSIRNFCIKQFTQGQNSFLETDPSRELVEEFYDALMINISPDQYTCRPVETIIEDNPAPTENFHARGYLTTRIYRIFEATISDASLGQAIKINHNTLSHQNLSSRALQDAKIGGRGRANAILALPMKSIVNFYSSISPQERNAPVIFEENCLDETVSAILGSVAGSKYVRL